MLECFENNKKSEFDVPLIKYPKFTIENPTMTKGKNMKYFNNSDKNYIKQKFKKEVYKQIEKIIETQDKKILDVGTANGELPLNQKFKDKYHYTD